MEPVSPSSRHGGILAGVLLAGLILAAVVVIAGIGIAHSLRVEKVRTANGEDISIRTPAGDIKIRAQEHAEIPADIPAYPGARQTKNSGAAELQWTSADGAHDKDIGVAGAETITSDPVETVFDFYRDKLPSWKVSRHRGQITLEESPGASGTEPRRFVAIRGKADGTHIGVASVGAPAAN